MVEVGSPKAELYCAPGIRASCLAIASCDESSNRVNRAGALQHLLDTWLAYRRDRPVSRRNALRQLMAAALYRAPAGRPAPCLLVLASAKDALVNPICSQHLAAHWKAALAIHPGAGHDLPLDAAAWVAARVGDWFAPAHDLK